MDEPGPEQIHEKLPFDQQHRVNPRQEIMEVSTRGGGSAVLSRAEFTAERAQLKDDF